MVDSVLVQMSVRQPCRKEGITIIKLPVLPPVCHKTGVLLEVLGKEGYSDRGGSVLLIFKQIMTFIMRVWTGCNV